MHPLKIVESSPDEKLTFSFLSDLEKRKRNVEENREQFKKMKPPSSSKKFPQPKKELHVPDNAVKNLQHEMDLSSERINVIRICIPINVIISSRVISCFHGAPHI